MDITAHVAAVACWKRTLRLHVGTGCIGGPGAAPLEAGAALGGAHTRLAARRVCDGAQVPAAIAQRGHAHAGRLDSVHAPLGQGNNVAAPLVHLCGQVSGLQAEWSWGALSLVQQQELLHL